MMATQDENLRGVSAGFTADWCPVCRKPVVMRLEILGRGDGARIVANELGAVVGFCVICECCGAVHCERSGRVPEGVLTREAASGLLAERQASNESWRRLADLYEAAAEDPHSLATEDRQKLLLMPFSWLVPRTARVLQASNDTRQNVGLFVLGVCFFGGFLLGSLLGFGLHARIGIDPALVGFGLGVGTMTLGYVVLVRQRRGKSPEAEAGALLISALAPLQPTLDELKILHHILHSRGAWFVDLRPDELHAEIQKAVAHQAPNSAR